MTLTIVNEKSGFSNLKFPAESNFLCLSDIPGKKKFMINNRIEFPNLVFRKWGGAELNSVLLEAVLRLLEKNDNLFML